MDTIDVNLDEGWHRGPVRVNPGQNGRTLILCPYGHFVASVERGKWADSVWSTQVPPYPAHVVTCHGKLPAKVEARMRAAATP